MAEDMIGWKPMDEDFESLSVNSYERGQTAALLPSPSSSQEKVENLKLYLEGFSSELTETGLKNYLRGIGATYLWLKLFRKVGANKKSRSFALLECKTLKEAQNFIQIMNNQKMFRAFVSFTSTDTERKRKEQIKDKEKEEYTQQVLTQIKDEENNERNLRQQTIVDSFDANTDPKN